MGSSAESESEDIIARNQQARLLQEYVPPTRATRQAELLALRMKHPASKSQCFMRLAPRIPVGTCKSKHTVSGYQKPHAEASASPTCLSTAYQKRSAEVLLRCTEDGHSDDADLMPMVE